VGWSASFTKKGEINPQSMQVETLGITSYDMQLLVARSVDEYENVSSDKKLARFSRPTPPASSN
jgi:hypothetical protein